MADSIMYHDGNRALQDRFDSRRISDRLEEELTRTAFTADDKAFIESAIYFFLSTADADGRPDCSFKGGPAGFVRVTGPSELAFPDYDGNGMSSTCTNVRAACGRCAYPGYASSSGRLARVNVILEILETRSLLCKQGRSLHKAPNRSAQSDANEGFRIVAGARILVAVVNNRKEVIQCLIVYRRGRRHP
jgi:hypothetical protein